MKKLAKVAGAALLSLALIGLPACSSPSATAGGSSTDSSNSSSSAKSSSANSGPTGSTSSASSTKQNGSGSAGSSPSSSRGTSSSSQSRNLTANDIVSVTSVETEPDKRYTKDYVAYVMDVTIENVADGSIYYGSQPITDVTIDYVDVQYLDASGNIVDTGVAYLNSGNGVTLTPGQSANFKAVVDTGKGITQLKVIGVDIEIGGGQGTAKFTNSSSLVYPTVSPAGTAD